MASRLLDFQIDKTDVKRVRTKLQRASGKSLYTRLQRANLTLGDQVARRIKAAAPRQTGNLRRSVKARPERRKGFGARGSSTSVLVGPTAPHRHLVIRGTGLRSAVGPRASSDYRLLPMYATRGKARLMGGKVVHRNTIANTGRMRANPFVDRAASGFQAKMARHIQKEWRALLR